MRLALGGLLCWLACLFGLASLHVVGQRPQPPHTADPYLAALATRPFDDVVLAALERANGTLPRAPAAQSATPLVDPFDPLTPDQRTRWQQLVSASGLPADAIPPVPQSYDPRVNGSEWSSKCPSIHEVRDQGDCNSDWAAAVASAFSDRLCIQSNGSISESKSIQDILSCCGWSCGIGCNGGYSAQAWSYIQNYGVVSGGSYGTTGTKGGCLPYSLQPCQLIINGTVRTCDALPGTTQTPVCPRGICQDSGSETWETSKHLSYAPYHLTSDTGTIAAELFYHGPVTATIDLYGDFRMQNTAGVYSHLDARLVGSLTVKLLGWGVKSRVKYWLAASTWGAGWGGYGGFFRIVRGTNECNVENAAVAAMWRRKQQSHSTVPKEEL